MPNSKGKLVREIPKHKPVWLPFPDIRRQEIFDAMKDRMRRRLEEKK